MRKGWPVDGCQMFGRYGVCCACICLIYTISLWEKLMKGQRCATTVTPHHMTLVFFFLFRVSLDYEHLLLTDLHLLFLLCSAGGSSGVVSVHLPL